MEIPKDLTKGHLRVLFQNEARILECVFHDFRHTLTGGFAEWYSRQGRNQITLADGFDRTEHYLVANTAQNGAFAIGQLCPVQIFLGREADDQPEIEDAALPEPLKERIRNLIIQIKEATEEDETSHRIGTPRIFRTNGDSFIMTWRETTEDRRKDRINSLIDQKEAFNSDGNPCSLDTVVIEEVEAALTAQNLSDDLLPQAAVYLG